ncbi:MAG: hypothetical protein DSM107014_07085 [Gomphosphaeria aponina SAG 52.96 = DSM 107014]|uniref:VWA containing CoxE family protein n=1 Tax=Gomphosphaeria aponina SAG 52.96 = DSM 107014 TaxID=1521640 RepID=A0A941GWC0_9CHRO|nr:hypothetical protein [Gomphosphaeria aponina SAG 52.96 = DSM 107014]
MTDKELLIAKSIIEYEPIFLPLFNQLRKENIPVGISEYLLAIKTIQARIELKDLERVQRFLCLVWVKSSEEQIIFNEKFEDLVKPELEKRLQEANEPSSTDHKDSQNQTKKDKKPSITSRSSSDLSSEQEPIKLRFRQRYNLIPRLPITRREMTEIWRNLRVVKREGVPEDLDVAGTINQICKVGFFLRPVLQPRRQNQVKLVLLIDHQGSMTPFDLLIEALQESIEKSGLLNKTSIYYFHNCPRSYLFTQPNLSKPYPLEEILSQEAHNNNVIIISDAGAARRTYNRERLSQTKRFIAQLRRYTYRYGWLNPVPQFQWKITTAEDIAQFIPMYPLNREGLNDLVKILLGHPFPAGVSLNGKNP